MKFERAIRLYRRHGFKDSAEIRHTHYERGNITLERSL
jgi:ribosomal protein S18 acetylase RimI-like enzyme